MNWDFIFSGQPNSDLFAPKVDKNDEKLLSDLMSDNPMQGDDNQSGFSAQWNALFGEAKTSNTNTNTQIGESIADSWHTGLQSNLLSPSSEFGDFMSAATTSDTQPASESDLFGILKNKESSKTSKNKNKSFLPSQLFDLDQSLYSQQSPRSGRLSTYFISIFIYI